MESTNKKQEILRASLRLCSTAGFEAASKSTIAQEVGIQKASLYSHFKSKDDILQAVVTMAYGFFAHMGKR